MSKNIIKKYKIKCEIIIPNDPKIESTLMLCLGGKSLSYNLKSLPDEIYSIAEELMNIDILVLKAAISSLERK